MGNAIVTINEIIELNRLLKGEGLQFKVHLHDACGSQSFTIEPVGEGKDKEDILKLRDRITDYFNIRGMKIRFSADQLSFQVVEKN